MEFFFPVSVRTLAIVEKWYAHNLVHNLQDISLG